MQPNSAVALVDGKWQSVAFPTTYKIVIESATWDADCAANPKNTVIKDSTGAVYLFDHFGVPMKLDGDAGARAIESM